MTPRVFPEPTVQLTWEEPPALLADGTPDPRLAPFEKGKVLKQFDAGQLQRMEESIRGPAVAAPAQAARTADGKRPTREVRTTATPVEKGNARRTPGPGPAQPPSGGPPAADASATSERTTPMPTARGADAPPVPPVPSAPASARAPAAPPASDPPAPTEPTPPPTRKAAPAPTPAPTPAASASAVINQSDKKGWTALTYAVFGGKPDTGAYLHLPYTPLHLSPPISATHS